MEPQDAWVPPERELVNPHGDARLNWQAEDLQEHQIEQARIEQEDQPDLTYTSTGPREETTLEGVTDWWWKVLKTSDENWISRSFANSVDENDFADVSPGWSMSDEEIAAWKKGVNEHYWDMLNEAVSPQHAEALKARALKAQRIQEIAFEDGIGQGISANLVSSILDPLAMVVSGGTEMAAAPFILAGKSTRLANSVRAGLTAAGSNAAVEGVLIANDPAKGIEDVGYAAAGGLVLGSLLGAGRSIDPVDRQLNEMAAKASKDFQEQMELDELVEAGQELSEAGKQKFARYLKPDGTVMSRDERIDVILKNIGDVDKTYGSAFRIDRASVTGGSANPVTRQLSSIFYNDAAAAKGHVRGEIASVWKTIFAGRHTSNFYRNQMTNFEAYLKEQGKGTFGAGLKHRTRAEFNEQVFKAQLGMPVESAAAKRQAQYLTKAYEDFKAAILDPSLGQKNSGAVPLADALGDGPYTTRIWNSEKVRAAIRKDGEDSVAQRVADAMRKKTPDLDEARALSIGRYLVKAVSKVKEHRQLDINKVLSARDLGNLKDILNDATDLSSDEIEDIANTLFGKAKEGARPDSGKTSRLRHKIDLADADIIDLLDTDSERLFLNYVNSMSGHIALARHGIKDEADFKALLEKSDDWLQEELTKPGMTPKKARKLEARARREKAILQASYDHLVGRPLELDPSGTASTAARLLNKMNFARLMGQMGFTQIPELGVAITQIGIRSTLRHLPKAIQTLRRARTDKKFADELMQELSDALGGWGGERLMHQVTNRVDEMGSRSAIGDRVIDKAEVGLDHLGRLTSDLSGFHLIDALLKNLAAKGQAQEFLKIARSGDSGIRKAFKDSFVSKRGLRMADIGLTEENFRPIAEQLRKHAAIGKGGTLKHLNLDNWDDKDALNRFTLAMRYQMDRSIIQVDFGDKASWGTGTTFGMEGPVGKTLWQFKSFMVASHAKLLVNGWKYRDVKMFNAFMVNSFLTYFVLNAQYTAKSWTKPEEDRQAYLDKVLSDESLAKATFQRSAWVGLIPTVTETGAEFAGADPIFTYRSSGLSSNFITGTPAYDLVFNGAIPSIGALTQEALNEDYTYTSADYQKLTRTLFLQNTLLVRGMLNELDDFPKFQLDQY